MNAKALTFLLTATASLFSVAGEASATETKHHLYLSAVDELTITDDADFLYAKIEVLERYHPADIIRSNKENRLDVDGDGRAMEIKFSGNWPLTEVFVYGMGSLDHNVLGCKGRSKPIIKMLPGLVSIDKCSR